MHPLEFWFVFKDSILTQNDNQMKNQSRLFFTIILATLLFSCSIAQEEKTVEKSFEGLDKIEADFASGDLTLVKGSSSTVYVKLVYTYDDDHFTPEFEQNGSKLEIEENFKRGNNNGYSKWTITMPDGIEIEINTASGDISADGLEVDIDSNSGSGDIDLSDISGDLDANTGSGDIDLEDYDGEISVNTGSGDIKVSDTEGEISLNAGSGDITLSSVNADFSVNTGSGDISGEQLTIAGSSSFNSGSGDTEVSLAKALDHNISLNSGSGNAELDFNGNEISGFITMKATKGRGDIVAPFKFDKEEEEEQGNQTIIKKTAKIGSKAVNINIGTGSGKAVIGK